jgi:PadR family transcriptional regulator
MNVLVNIGTSQTSRRQKRGASWTPEVYLGRVCRVVRTGFSAQTLAVLASLLEGRTEWQHGYDLARRTGLKSGTLYPILIRLADRDLVEARWEDEQPAGRPRRHLYRLTAAGAEQASTAMAAAKTKAKVTARTRPAVAG